jgi:hypothetical protein
MSAAGAMRVSPFPRSMRRKMPAAIAMSLASLVMSAASAEARIVCRDGYQVVNGQEIATPYCGDNYVAAIAREYGGKVSDAELRNNPAKKDEVCRWIGTDTRVRPYCNEPGGSGRSR